VIKQYHRLPITPPYSAFKGDAEEWYPMLFVRLSKKHAKPSARFSAVLDTGSSFCLFRADLGQSIGIDVLAGTRQTIGGVVPGARADVYFHRLTLYVESNWIVEINAGFIENFQWGALLGRRGFFDQFDVKFKHSVNPPVFEIERIPAIQ
jgi:hypothetical protein